MRKIQVRGLEGYDVEDYEEEVSLSGNPEEIAKKLKKEEEFSEKLENLAQECKKLILQSEKSDEKKRLNLYWRVGRLIVEFDTSIPAEERRNYNKTRHAVVQRLYELLGNIKSFRYIREMVKLGEFYPDFKQLNARITWSEYFEIIRLKSPEHRKIFEEKMINDEIKDKEQLRTEIEKFMKEHGLVDEDYTEFGITDVSSGMLSSI